MLTAVAVFCAIAMVAIDRPLALFLKGHLTPHLEGFFKTITVLGEAGPWFALSGGAFVALRIAAGRSGDPICRQRLAERARAALFMLTALGASGALVAGLKVVIGRYRPRALFESGLYGFEPFNTQWAMNSFPSGHSQTIWAAMVALVCIHPRYDAAYLVLAVLVSASRFVTTVHYFSDVIMGSCLGIIVTLWIRQAFEVGGGTIRLRFERDRI
ncbi:MAG: phosphatase PAP2 family protein [Alphaproteobacteria bacterium]